MFIASPLVENWLVAIAALIMGAALGSFINVVVLRYGSGTSSLKGRSLCPSCQRTLRWWELVPLISFIVLRGRCSRCRAPLSWQYPLVEALMGLFMALLAVPLPTTSTHVISTILEVSLVACLLTLGLIDLRTFLLPDR